MKCSWLHDWAESDGVIRCLICDTVYTDDDTDEYDFDDDLDGWPV